MANICLRLKSLIWRLEGVEVFYVNTKKVFNCLQLTPDNSNPRELEPKPISPGFLSYNCDFTLGNSNPR